MRHPLAVAGVIDGPGRKSSSPPPQPRWSKRGRALMTVRGRALRLLSSTVALLHKHPPRLPGGARGAGVPNGPSRQPGRFTREEALKTSLGKPMGFPRPDMRRPLIACLAPLQESPGKPITPRLGVAADARRRWPPCSVRRAGRRSGRQQPANAGRLRQNCRG